MNSLSDLLNASLKNIDHKLFKDAVKVDVDIEQLGDGQVIIISDIKRVILSLLTSSGEKKQVKAIAKLEPPEGPGKSMALDTGAFATEIMMYSTIIKSMDAVLAEINDKEYLWPECYLSKDNTFLFQDLCEVGYRIVPTYNFLDVEHTLLVMKGIGKFHALSLILKERSLFDPSKIGKPFFAKPNPGMDNIQRKSMEEFNEAIKTWGPEWSSVPERLLKYFSRPSEKMNELWLETRGKWDVVNHGDFTMRNMMFHYQPNSANPDDIKFVDFQMCHWSNLGFDLAMLLYSSLMPSVRDENMDKFLTVYTDSFVTTCKSHGYKGPLPTFEDVKSALKLVHNLGNAMALFQLPFFIQSKNDDIQKKTDEYVRNYTNNEDPKPSGESFINYSDPDIVALLKSELRRCMNEKAF